MSIAVATIFAHAFVWAVIAFGVAWIIVSIVKTD
jgi:hypothetical protein